MTAMPAPTGPTRSTSPAPEAGGLRSFAARMIREPNAIWMREMRQSSRLGRTPWILFALTLSISLLMCSIGGLAAADHAAPAQLGGALFQVFFSIAYLVVVIVGPAVAANSIASEREGKTWEAVLLTGLSPKEIARGKFLAAYTTIALYIVVLAPVGALSFLFGGVTAVEVVVAFVFLFLVAGLAVAFGLAVSSLMSSLRGAIVVTLMLAICIGPFLYSTFGFGASFGIHKEWSEVPEAFPIWLPLAYSRATFGLEYVLLLLLLPLLLVIIPAWFLYEATISNLTAEAEDRSTGLKRWFAYCTPLLAAACVIPSLLSTSDGDRVGFAISGVLTFAMHLGFSSRLFTAEPAGPSRRVRTHWARSHAGALRRFFGPGLTKTSVLVMLLGILGMVGIAAVTMAALELFGTSSDKQTKMLEIFVFTAYAAPFFVFIVGLCSWLRARGNSPWIARLIAGGVLFLVAAGPWVVAAIGGVLARGNDHDWIIVGSPSPFYAFVMVSAVDSPSDQMAVPAGLACAMGWGALGLALLAAAGRRCHRVVAEHDVAVAQAEAALDAEEAARKAAMQAPSEGAAAVANPGR
jgi:ABC-type transport system involved in multi-copper enzyme maturation permease subunit